jgi:SAM-dependent methyltransferase
MFSANANSSINWQPIVMTRCALDSAFRAKFTEVPQIIADYWADAIGGLQGKRILDFGCGEGTIALGIAHTYGPALVVGADINREHEQCSANAVRYAALEELPANLHFEEISRGAISRHEAFDFIYSWSTFEHIDQSLMDDVIVGLRDKLRDRGHLLVQIAPLYYSPEGSHLWAIGFKQWEHLARQIDHIHTELYACLERSLADSLWSMFTTLNKITAPKLIKDISEHGFELIREYSSSASIAPPDDLLFAYTKDVLTTDQVVVLFRKR